MLYHSAILRFLSITLLASSVLANMAPKPRQAAKPRSPPYVYKQTNRKEILRRQEKKRAFVGGRGIAHRAAPSAFPGIPDVSPTTDESVVYYFFHYGVGAYETDENPNNASEFAPPVRTTFPGDQDQGEVVQSCADFAWDQGYFAFQVYYRISTDTWTCVSYVFAYPEGVSNSAYFNVIDSDVTLAYGYQHRWID
ncbi:uncharacterized protein I303_102365 [Kwoniella dejecticola CBS 10117]|uniref:Uncharacterized protein n=1 Tax=Kwoniella dejecticola CBS 10117 TaxID=1296121 RepID=A0A1A6AB64_9TREE|nr:uncharacterized protein I303_01495 [Kwoniella dejecticola CBS 10117]OBR87293.1 hypothetical protein I303_01495 [Kwoniella dejecticola CBS 10117]